jgi:hypothetical protein
MDAKSRTSSVSETTTLAQRLAEMVRKGAVLGLRGRKMPETLGLIRVDEAEKRLFFMRRWAQGTGGVHIFRWGRYELTDIYVNFYRARDDELKAVIGPYDEFPEIDPRAARIDLAAWTKALEGHRAAYEEFFASECEDLKDAGDDDDIPAVDNPLGPAQPTPAEEAGAE